MDKERLANAADRVLAAHWPDGGRPTRARLLEDALLVALMADDHHIGPEHLDAAAERIRTGAKRTWAELTALSGPARPADPAMIRPGTAHLTDEERAALQEFLYPSDDTERLRSALFGLVDALTYHCDVEPGERVRAAYRAAVDVLGEDDPDLVAEVRRLRAEDQGRAG